MNNLYKEEILEHYKDPQNYGTLSSFTNFSKLANPFCGDEIEIYLDVKENQVNDVRFEGKGCAISVAGASILTEFVKGKDVKSITEFTHSEMLALLEIEVSESRKKCALLALETIKDALKIPAVNNV